MSCESLDSNINNYIILMNLFKLIFRYKIFLIELLLKLRTLIIVLFFYLSDNIDNIDLSLNEDEEKDQKSDTDKTETEDKIISTSNSNIETPLLELESKVEENTHSNHECDSRKESIIPLITETDIQEEGEQVSKDLLILKDSRSDLWNKKTIENAFKGANAGAIISLGAIATTALNKAPTIGTKAAVAGSTIAIATIATTTLSVAEDMVLKSLENNTNSRPPSPGYGGFNLIDTNSLVNKVLSFINNYNNLDNQSKLIVSCIIMILIIIIYFIYIFSFVVAPSIFDTIKDILPIKLKNFFIKFININRKISVPFVILSFIMIILTLFFVIFFLSIAVIFKSFFIILKDI